MANKIAKGIAFFILFLAFLSIYGALVERTINHELYVSHELGIYKSAIKYLYKLPGMAQRVFHGNEIKGIPEGYVKIDPEFDEINKLGYDLFGLSPFYNNKSKNWDIKLLNFKNDSVIYKWEVKREDYYHKKTKRIFQNACINAPVLLPDKSIIVLLDLTHNLLRLDSLSNIVWHNTQRHFHHTMNLSLDSNIWVCSATYQTIKNYNWPTAHYVDNGIAKIDINTGEIMTEKSISELLMENGLKTLGVWLF